MSWTFAQRYAKMLRDMREFDCSAREMLGVGAAAQALLGTLQDERWVDEKTLRDHAECESWTLSRALAEAGEAGYIETRVNPADRRCQDVRLTALGQEALEWLTGNSPKRLPLNATNWRALQAAARKLSLAENDLCILFALQAAGDTTPGVPAESVSLPAAPAALATPPSTAALSRVTLLPASSVKAACAKLQSRGFLQNGVLTPAARALASALFSIYSNKSARQTNTSSQPCN